MAEHRERVLSQMHLLVDNGGVRRAFPEEYGGEANNGANIAGFMELVLADPSLQIKSGVQWGLFGSAVLPARHEGAPRQVAAGDHGPGDPRCVRHDRDRARVGCRGHRHDGDLRPRHRGVRHQHAVPRRVEGLPRQRGAARHGGDGLRAAHHDGVNYGVHCFFVPLRDETATSCPASAARTTASRAASTASTTAACTSITSGSRATNLLNRYGDVAPDGTYSSHISSPGRRFFTMLGALVQGRVSLDGAATPASRSRCTSRSPTPTSAASSIPAPAAMRSCCWTTASTSVACCPLLAPNYA